MSSRWKKVWGDFWGNKSRTLLTIITIAVGTFAVGFNSNLASYMLESMDGDYLMRRNLMLLVARARFGGQIEDGNAFAVMTDCQT